MFEKFSLHRLALLVKQPTRKRIAVVQRGLYFAWERLTLPYPWIINARDFSRKSYPISRITTPTVTFDVGEFASQVHVAQHLRSLLAASLRRMLDKLQGIWCRVPGHLLQEGESVAPEPTPPELWGGLLNGPTQDVPMPFVEGAVCLIDPPQLMFKVDGFMVEFMLNMLMAEFRVLHQRIFNEPWQLSMPGAINVPHGTLPINVYFRGTNGVRACNAPPDQFTFNVSSDSSPAAFPFVEDGRNSLSNCSSSGDDDNANFDFNVPPIGS